MDCRVIVKVLSYFRYKGYDIRPSQHQVKSHHPEEIIVTTTANDYQRAGRVIKAPKQSL